MNLRRPPPTGGTVWWAVLAAVLLCASPALAQWEHRGDLNLNGLPFELIDAAIFADYFQIGMPAFTIVPDSQVAATDINMDGIVLTVADYVMMIRIEIGAGDPPPADPETFAIPVTYNYTDTSLLIAANFDRIPASAYLEFGFAQEPVHTARLLQSGGAIAMGTVEEGHVVLALITGMNEIPVGSGFVPLLELVYQGDRPTRIVGGVLGAAGEEGSFIPDTLFTVGDINNDGNINIGDAVFMVNWIFRSGPFPPHLEAADVNCDLLRNIGDAVYIVNFVFRSGPGPCGPPSGRLVSHSDCLTMEKGDGDGEATIAQDCIEYQYDGQGTLLLRHANAGLNCCPEDFAAVITVVDGVITIDETPIPGFCDCLCLFNLDYTVINLPPGTYTLSILEQCLHVGDLPLKGTIDLMTAPSGSFCLTRDHYPW
ncbi:MAG: hypothetical protein GYA46_13385 [candidate division Zixibacteria bacterium]|nr:hypothetical protein [candidate division Zixibacteria bacterium]